jgi:hypothetical protein
MFTYVKHMVARVLVSSLSRFTRIFYPGPTWVLFNRPRTLESPDMYSMRGIADFISLATG